MAFYLFSMTTFSGKKTENNFLCDEFFCTLFPPSVFTVLVECVNK